MLDFTKKKYTGKPYVGTDGKITYDLYDEKQ